MISRRLLVLGLWVAWQLHAETPPWQDGVVISVEKSAKYTDVAVAVSNTLYVCRPFDGSPMGQLSATLNRRKNYVEVDAREVRAGASAKFAVHSNVSATLRSEKGHQYNCELVGQRPYTPQGSSEANTPPAQSEARSEVEPQKPRATERVPEEPRTQGSTRAMTNADVVQLRKAGLGDEVLIEKIKSSPSAYTLEPKDLIALKKAGLSDAVIAAMIRAGSSGK